MWLQSNLDDVADGCQEVRSNFNCPQTNGAECMGFFYCSDILDDLNALDEFEEFGIPINIP